MNNALKEKKTITGSVPSWLVNLLGFGLLIALVLATFFYQMHEVNKSLKTNALDRSRMVSAIIEENLAGANLALMTIDQVVTTFLQDKVNFIAYLDGIDPLQPEELTALSRETGLLGITLVRSDNSLVSGPGDWFPEPVHCGDATGLVRYQDDKALLLKNIDEEDADLSCILTGLDAGTITSLREKNSLPALLKVFSALPGIDSVELHHEPNTDGRSSVQLISQADKAIAQSKLSTPLGTLVVNLDAHQFIQRRNRLRQQFFFFAALLLGLGLFFSWLLYRFQKKNLEQVRTFEQIIAHEHEAAALGRTTATITHEIRNPLNAIHMGLQRLRMESTQLDREQQELISAMGEAVKRTSAILSELQRFTRPLQTVVETVDMGRQLQQLLTLYQSQLQHQHIHILLNCQDNVTLEGDRNLLNELLENLLKNAIEAQPDGGDVRIGVVEKNGLIHLQMENGGFLLKENEVSRIGEPYFTTKTRGTGLGLALSKKIAKAHGGTLDILPDPDQQRLTIILTLPKRPRE